LEATVLEHKLPTDNLFIGGFSSGGNVTMLLSNYLIEQQSQIQPKGIFIVDSPVDLLALYQCAQKNIARNFNPGSVRESQGIIDNFDNYFGKPTDGQVKYEASSPFIASLSFDKNIRALNRLKFRLYTEPDIKWWKENRANDYADMNAFGIKKLADHLKNKMGNSNAELIETENKGYRSNGQRHPHSWSIVDIEKLIVWMLE